MTETMVERVAKAICLKQWGGYPVDIDKREAWPHWAEAIGMARAAIEEVRASAPELARENSPSLDVFAMWRDGPVFLSPEEIWNMTFNAALQEKTDA